MNRVLWVCTAIVLVGAALIAFRRQHATDGVLPPPIGTQTRIEVQEGAVKVMAGRDSDTLHAGDIRVVNADGIAKAVPAAKAASPSPPAPGVGPFDLRGRVIQGTIVDLSGIPIHGVSITIHPAVLAERSGVAPPSAVTAPTTLPATYSLTAQAGVFDFQLRASDPETWNLICTAEGFADQEIEDVTSFHEREDRYTITLLQRRSVTGQVFDATGSGLGNVAIRIDIHSAGSEVLRGFFSRIIREPRQSHIEITSERDGRFRFPLLDNQSFDLCAERYPFIPASISGDFRSGELNVVLHRHTDLVGRVLDENDQPIRFADVTIRSVSSVEPGFLVKTVQSDQDGWFETERILPRGTYDVSAKQARYHDAGEGHRTVAMEELEKDVELRLVSEVYSISGLVLEYGTNRGVPGIEVLLRPWEQGGKYGDILSKAVSDGEGRFQFPNIVPGEYGVFGNGPVDETSPYDISRTHFGKRVSPRREESDNIVLYAARKGVLSGRVIDPSGSPVPGANVGCCDAWGVPETDTGEDGTFTLRVPPKEFSGKSKYRLKATKDANRKQHTGLSAWLELSPGEEAGDITIVLDDFIRVSGRILDEEKNPVAGAAVSLHCHLTDKDYECVSGANGAYNFADVIRADAGPTPYDYAYRLKVVAGGYATANHLFSAAAGQDAIQRDVVLDPELSIRGRVSDVSGRPLEGVIVYYLSPRRAGGPSATTNAEGVYEFTNLGPGHYGLTFQYNQRPLLAGELFGVSAGTSDADITLTHTLISLHITLEVPEGVDPMSRYHGWVARKQEDGTLRSVILFNGIVSEGFSSAMIWEPGNYQVRCYVPSCPVAVAWVAVDAQSSEPVIEITLPIDPPGHANTVVGRLVLPPGLACHHLNGPYGDFVIVQPDGSFRLEGMPDGPVEFTAWPFDETGIPMKTNIVLDAVAEGGGILNLGDIRVGEYLGRG